MVEVRIKESEDKRKRRHRLKGEFPEQSNKPSQSRQGKIFDVAVDIRKSSTNFGK
jgi:dTDP-4-dehydrorhamnose 3,5-epimerase-like enzyme